MKKVKTTKGSESKEKKRNYEENEDCWSQEASYGEINEILDKLTSQPIENDSKPNKTQTFSKRKKTKKIYQKHKVKPSEQIGITNYVSLSSEDLKNIIHVIDMTILSCQENLSKSLEEKVPHLKKNLKTLHEWKATYQTLKDKTIDKKVTEDPLKDQGFADDARKLEMVTNIILDIKNLDDGDHFSRLRSLLWSEQCVVDYLLKIQKENSKIDALKNTVTPPAASQKLLKNIMKKMKDIAYMNFEDEFRSVRRTENTIAKYEMCRFLKKKFEEEPHYALERSEASDPDKTHYYNEKRWDDLRWFEKIEMAKNEMGKNEMGFFKNGFKNTIWNNMAVDHVSTINIEKEPKTVPLVISYEGDETILGNNYDKTSRHNVENDFEEFEIRVVSKTKKQSNEPEIFLSTDRKWQENEKLKRKLREKNDFEKNILDDEDSMGNYKPKKVLKKKRFNPDDFFEEAKKIIELKDEKMINFNERYFKEYDKKTAVDKLDKLMEKTRNLRHKKEEDSSKNQLLELKYFLKDSKRGIKKFINKDLVVDRLNKSCNNALSEYGSFLEKITEIKKMLKRLVEQHPNDFDMEYSRGVIPQSILEEMIREN